jgi:hypothetical protein
MLTILLLGLSITICYECIRRRRREKVNMVKDEKIVLLIDSPKENKEYFKVVQSPMSDKEWDLIV